MHNNIIPIKKIRRRKKGTKDDEDDSNVCILFALCESKIKMGTMKLKFIYGIG